MWEDFDPDPSFDFRVVDPIQTYPSLFCHSGWRLAQYLPLAYSHAAGTTSSVTVYCNQNGIMGISAGNEVGNGPGVLIGARSGVPVTLPLGTSERIVFVSICTTDNAECPIFGPFLLVCFYIFDLLFTWLFIYFSCAKLTTC